jgi:hypothetical protein
MLATLTSRKPLEWKQVPPVSDSIPWGQPYVPGGSSPAAVPLSAGNYTLAGKVTGHAEVAFVDNSGQASINEVAATYYHFSDDGINFISGTEEITATNPNVTLTHIDWYSDLHGTGISHSSKITGPGGFHFEVDLEQNKFYANGTLTTIVDGVVYKQPANGSWTVWFTWFVRPNGWLSSTISRIL